MDILSSFLSGIAVALFLVGSLFFFRFWRQTRESLFINFSVTFFLLALVQVLLTLNDIPDEERSYYYLIRLASFALVLFAVWQKNKIDKPL